MAEELTDAELIRESLGEVPGFVKSSALLMVVPSLILGGGAVLDAWVSPLHSVAPAVVGIIKGVCAGLYMKAVMTAAGGSEKAGPVTHVLSMIFAFVAVEYGDWALILPVLIWVLPLMDYAGMYAEEAAFGGIFETAKAAPVLWFVSMLAMLLALVMFWLVLSLPMSLYSWSSARESAWLANLSGGVLVGPLVHAALIFRARLFVSIHGDPA
ncbi:MAG: hypothetical protein QM817_17795 [Archangium sp.]